MNQQEYSRLEREFMGIRDETGIHENTAVRIGTAFLDLLRYSMSGEFNEISFNKVLNKPEFLQGLVALGAIILGEYAEGLQGGIITPEGVAELKRLWVREYAKIGDGSIHYDAAGRVIPALEINGDSTFSGNLSSPEFISSFFGGLGWAIQKKEVVNAVGVVEYKYVLEIDDAVIRNTLRVFQMIVSQLMGENANRYFSDMMEVDHYDPVSKKVYLKTANGRLYNPFRIGDCIEVQQYNGMPTEENNWYVTKKYELKITAVGVGPLEDKEDRLDWVEFSNFETTMEDGSPQTLINEYDTFVRADNDRDKNRKGLVSIMAVGENTPYMDILYGMKTDPKHALKGRLGNLEGIRTDLFGWLEGFGAYINNLYGVGKFFNFQTGESLNASMSMTRELFKTIYSETLYDISDDDNFITNGFFQKDLYGWEKCAADGSEAPEVEDPEFLATKSGDDDATPLLVNGTPMAVNARTTARVDEYEGILMLHLYGMGVAQDFSLIKANGTHMEARDDNPDDTQMTEVGDTLYMGVRILPLTAGTLTVSFIKEGGSTSGWTLDIDESTDWKLYQARDYEDDPWDYEGNGRMVVSYTGECYIRFVALMTDPIADSKKEYSTMFLMNSRDITLRARRLTSDLTEAVADFNIKYDQITSTVANNWQAFQTAKTSLENEVSRIDGDIADLNADQNGRWASFATWQSQTNTSISSFATALSVDGHIMSMSSVVQTFQEIRDTVEDNYDSLDGRIGTLSVRADSISGRVSTVEGWWSVINNLDSEVGSLTTTVGGIETWKDSVSMWVQSVNSTLTSLQDPMEWEQGKVTPTAGYTLGLCKGNDAATIRYYMLVPITVATCCMLKSAYTVRLCYFDSMKCCLTGTNTSGWKTADSYGRVKFNNIPSNAVYASIELKLPGPATFTKEEVGQTGFYLSNDNVVSEAYMKVFIDDWGTSNAKIKADRISFDYGEAIEVTHSGKLIFRLAGDGDIVWKGKVYATQNYMTFLDVNDYLYKHGNTNTYTIDPDAEPYTFFYGSGSISNPVYVNLPSASSYPGMELNFYSRPSTQSAIGLRLVVDGSTYELTKGCLAKAVSYGSGWILTQSNVSMI